MVVTKAIVTSLRKNKRNVVDLNSFLKEISSSSIQLMYVLEVVKLLHYCYFFFKMEMVQNFQRTVKINN